MLFCTQRLSTNIFQMKPLRIETSEISTENILKLNSLGFSCSLVLNEADRMTNSEDPDQTDQGLLCFVSPICPNT